MRSRPFRLVPIFLMLACGLSLGQTGRVDRAQDLYEKGMGALQGSASTRSLPNALAYFRSSADQGFSPAQVVLGYLYDIGQGVTMDRREALEWYKKAAQQDDPLAQWLAGRIIYAGFVPPRDLNEARMWLEKSRSHGNPFAQYLLGKISLERSDYQASAASFRDAAEQGLPQAQLELARSLRDGRGVTQDYFEAYVWLLMSYDAGLQESQTDLQALEAELSSAQLDKAKAKARNLEGTTTRSAVVHGCTGWQGEFGTIPTPPPPEIQRFCR
jgi:hypothetical protein